MKRQFIVATALAVLLLVTGCYTSVTMKKVGPANPNPEGLRVKLPASFLVGRLDTNFANVSFAFGATDISNIPVFAAFLATNQAIAPFFKVKSANDLTDDLAAISRSDLLVNFSNIVMTGIADFVTSYSSDQLKSMTNNIDLSGVPMGLLVDHDPTNQRFVAQRLLLAGFPQTLALSQDNLNAFQFTDPLGFASQLQNPTNPVAAALLNSVVKQSSANFIRLYLTSAQKAAALPANLVNVLNQLDQGPPLDKVVSENNMSGQTYVLKQSIANYPAIIPRFNRWVLHDAFSNFLPALPPLTHVVYDVEMLPDPDEEYAIASSQFLAKQTVAIHHTPEAYLVEVDMNQDATTIAAAMATGAGQYFQRGHNFSESYNSNGVLTTTTITTTTGGGGGSGGGSGSGGSGNGNGGGSGNGSSSGSSSPSGGSGNSGNGGSGNNANGNGSSKTTTQVSTTVSAPGVLAGPIVVIYQLDESPLPTNDCSALRFTADNFVNVQSLVDTLTTPSNSPAPALVSQIAKEMESYLNTTNSLQNEPLLSKLADSFNWLLYDQKLVDQPFGDLQVSPQTQDLIDLRNKSLHPSAKNHLLFGTSEYIRLNHSLLLDLFPDSLTTVGNLHLKPTDFQIFSMSERTDRVQSSATLTGLLNQPKSPVTRVTSHN